MKYSILLLFTLFISCNPTREEPVDSPKHFFDLQGFIKDQVQLLDKLHPTVEKNLAIDGETESVKNSEIKWEKELSLFVSADLNKPGLLDAYLISQPASNTTVYTLKPGFSELVKTMTVVKDSLTSNPMQIRVETLDANRLYQSEKTLEISCEKDGKNWLISRYRISGYQQLRLLGKDEFAVDAKILH